MKYISEILLATIYNLLLVVGTAYIVFWLHHSGWWFALTVVLLASCGGSEDAE